MIDDARLKALALAGDTKEAVNRAMSSEHPVAEAKRLAELHSCLEQIEADLRITALDHSIFELQSLQQKLVQIDSGLEGKSGIIKSVARKVAALAKEIGVVIDLEEKVVKVVP
jgi:hypothetical protein